jgi:hypothetical protein
MYCFTKFDVSFNSHPYTAANYRARVIQMLPSLAKLDNEEIGDAERRVGPWTATVCS